MESIASSFRQRRPVLTMYPDKGASSSHSIIIVAFERARHLLHAHSCARCLRKARRFICHMTHRFPDTSLQDMKRVSQISF
jgi:hypothetical protein